MFTAKLEGIEVGDGRAPDEFLPADQTNFETAVFLRVGYEEGDGSNDFHLTICTPKWLEEALQRNGEPIWGRHKLIVSVYDGPQIARKLTKLVNEIRGDTWNDVVAKISRFAHWEFEDYIKDSGIDIGKK